MSNETDRVNSGLQIASLEDVFVMDSEKFVPIQHYAYSPDPPVAPDEVPAREKLRHEFHRVYERYGRKPSFYVMGLRAYARYCLEMAGPLGFSLLTHYGNTPIVLDRESPKDRISGIFEAEIELPRVLGSKP